MVLLQLTEGLGLIDSGIKVFEGIDSDKHQAATTRQGIKRMLALFRSSSGTCTYPPVFLDTGVDDPDHLPRFQEEVPPPYIVICFIDFMLLYIFCKCKYNFFPGQNSLSGTMLPILMFCLWENLLQHNFWV